MLIDIFIGPKSVVGKGCGHAPFPAVARLHAQILDVRRVQIGSQLGYARCRPDPKNQADAHGFATPAALPGSVDDDEADGAALQAFRLGTQSNRRHRAVTTIRMEYAKRDDRVLMLQP